MVAISVLASLTLLTLARAFTFTVTVGIDETNGQPGLGFDPSTINPAAGDTITFTYQLPDYIKNPKSAQHSATQSTFDNPCSPKPDGFDTGVQSTGSVNSNSGSTFNLLVNDTQPSWFYSSANTDCNSGMVLAINPPTSGEQTAAAFKEKAKTAPISSTPSSSSSAPAGSTASGDSASGATAGSAPSSSPSSGAIRAQAETYLPMAFAAIAIAGSIVRL